MKRSCSLSSEEPAKRRKVKHETYKKWMTQLSYSSLYLNFNVQSKSENGRTKLNMVRQTVQPYFDCNLKLCNVGIY